MRSAIDKLFAKLSARYGSKFTSNLVGPMEFIVDEWCEVLAGCSPAEIAHGLNVWTGDWPPNAVEFWKACTNFDSPVTDEEHRALGQRIGVFPHPGESWRDFNARVKRQIHAIGPRKLLDTTDQKALEALNVPLLP